MQCAKTRSRKEKDSKNILSSEELIKRLHFKDIIKRIKCDFRKRKELIIEKI